MWGSIVGVGNKAVNKTDKLQFLQNLEKIKIKQPINN